MMVTTKCLPNKLNLSDREHIDRFFLLILIPTFSKFEDAFWAWEGGDFVVNLCGIGFACSE